MAKTLYKTIPYKLEIQRIFIQQLFLYFDFVIFIEQITAAKFQGQ